MGIVLALFDVFGDVVGQHHGRDFVLVDTQLAHLAVYFMDVLKRKRGGACLLGVLGCKLTSATAENNDVELAIAHEAVAAVNASSHFTRCKQACYAGGTVGTDIDAAVLIV